MTPTTKGTSMDYKLKVEVVKDTSAGRLWRDEWRKKCQNIMQLTYQHLQIERPARAKISVLLTNNETMRLHNFQYCSKDYPTNILSFPADFARQPHQAKFLGDIAMGYEIIAQESLDNKCSFSAHFHHLCIHGLLHLLGYDHIKPKDARVMEGEEIRLLSHLFSIPNPYIDYV